MKPTKTITKPVKSPFAKAPAGYRAMPSTPVPKIDLTVHLDSLDDHHLKHVLSHIIEKEKQIMATLKDLQTAIAETQTDVAALTAALTGDVIITPSDSDALLASLNALDASIKAIVPATIAR